jgi:hypothetical protein
MRIRALLFVVVLLLVPAIARANDHTASIFGAISFMSGSTLSGGHGQLEASWPTSSRLHDFLSIIVDASVHGGSDNGDSVTRAALVGGVRFSGRVGAKSVPFAQVLLGVMRSHRAAAAGNDAASVVGGGYEHLLGDTTSTDSQGWSLRTELDWVRAGGDNSARFSIGAAYRFKKPPPLVP